MAKRESSYERRRDILEAFNLTLRRMASANPDVLIGDVISETYKSCAPRFYLTIGSAQRGIKSVLNGTYSFVEKPMTEAMYKELAKRYVSIVPGETDRIRSDVVRVIIEQPAPSFYLTRRSFRKILYQALNEIRG